MPGARFPWEAPQDETVDRRSTDKLLLERTEDLALQQARTDQRVQDHIAFEGEQLKQLKAEMEWVVDQINTWSQRWATWLDHKRWTVAIITSVASIVGTELVHWIMSQMTQ